MSRVVRLGVASLDRGVRVPGVRVPGVCVPGVLLSPGEGVMEGVLSRGVSDWWVGEGV